ncbi:hypothetical protein [Rhabdochromatium marinum]|uniref:hypothetical protein n=1 Tax=Rhabdochromatium marinum TaxID=48729 RepID=UPI001905FF76|nr:hypothetical protein [Rhabdochromatium marinum]MBK1647386.1 hypothetical protein [Rhabdochromatium marinum]
MPTTDTSRLYQQYPHLKQIDELWGTRAGRDFLNELIIDNRDDTRQGFPLEHAKTIFDLLIEHDKMFPQFDDSREFNPGIPKVSPKPPLV